jgi:hypothetical protein
VGAGLDAVCGWVWVCGLRSLTSDGKSSSLSANEATLIADGSRGNLSFRKTQIALASDQMLELELPPRGGFVLFENAQ